MIAQPQTQQPQATFQSASLYVGDLHNDVTEGVLFDLFNRVGPVASIRVCRDAVTRRSLGYAYVNFHNVQDAERSLDTMNFTDIKGRPCRIMWSQRDPSLRKSGVGNIFVKNLAPTVDNKGLFDTFSVFGNILSCKVAMDENGVSKGYGYVHYETAEAAQDAIQKFNGNFIEELEVFVGPFVRRQERSANVNWTNLYVKQFPTSWDDAKIRELFGNYGTIANVFLTKDESGKSKGFGFVNFSEHESADAALKELNGKKFPDPDAGEEATFELYVNKAQKRVDRVREIKNKLEAEKEDKISKFQGMNLYVKNIDDSVTDEYFREQFSKFGTVTSARIMREGPDNISKGFGFVCFSSSDEAQRAQAEMNNKMIRSKPITITLHQRKEIRRAQLAATYGPRNARFAAQGGQNTIPMPYMPMYMPQGGQPNAYPGQPRPFGYQNQQAGYSPRGGGQMSPRGLPFNAATGPGGRGGMSPQQAAYYQGPGQYGPGVPSQGMMPQGGVVPKGYPARMMTGPNGQPIPGQPQQVNPMTGVPGMQQQRPRPMNGQMNVVTPQSPSPRGIPAGAGGRGVGGYMTPNGYMQQPQMQQQMGMMGGQPQTRGVVPVPTQPGIKFNSNVRNQSGALQQQQQMMQPQQMMQQPQSQPSTMPILGEPLDDQALAQADPQMQKNMIGEKLYPLIYIHQPALAGKITGMLLEMDNAELLNLIESPEALQHKIDEALIVLKNHQQMATTSATAEEQ